MTLSAKWPLLPLFALARLHRSLITGFDSSHYHTVVASTIDSGIRVKSRMQFTSMVYRSVFDRREYRKPVSR